MTTTHTTTTDQAQPTRGRRVQLATYTTDQHEQRQLIGQRIDGIVHVFDEPTTGEGRTYLVETHLDKQGELDALIHDYVQKSTSLGFPAMWGWF